MTKDVALRYASAAELRAELLRFERGRPLLGGPVGHCGRAARARWPVRAVAARVAPGPLPARAAAPRPRKRRTLGCRRVRDDCLRPAGRADRDAPRAIGLRRQRHIRPAPRRPQGHRCALPDRGGNARQGGIQGRRATTRTASRHRSTVLESGSRGGAQASQGRHDHAHGEQCSRSRCPAIVGKTRAEATGILAGRHIIGDYVEEDAPDQPPGIVLRTDPAEGSPIPKSLPFVRVTLSRGSAGRGSRRREPRSRRRLGCARRGRPQSCARIQAGVERHHCPRQGRRHRSRRRHDAPPDSEVTLLISTGPALVDVPDVRRKDAEPRPRAS